MNNFKDNVKLATTVTSVTLVGFIGEFPMKRGNCFSVRTNDNEDYRIVNFNHENLEELIRLEILKFPIQISLISKHHAVIADGRIPNEWYSARFCETCTPKDLLPLPQQLTTINNIRFFSYTHISLIFSTLYRGILFYIFLSRNDH